MNYKLPVFLYHGSTYIIKDKLEPRSSIVINNKKAVFATPEKMIALSFLPNWDNSHFEHGSFNNKKNLTIIEKSKIILINILIIKKDIFIKLDQIHLKMIKD